MSDVTEEGLAQLCALEDTGQVVVPTEFALEQEVCTIGRHSSCNVMVQSIAVSRLHAKVERDGLRYVLSDAGSTNGTFVNGQRIQGSHVLKHKDIIGLGTPAASLRFFDPDPTFKQESQGLRYDERLMLFFYEGQQLNIQMNQFRLLHHLYQHANQVCTRESCAEAIWGSYDPGRDAGTLDGVVAQTRRAMREIDPQADLIRTRQGVGYLLQL